MEALWDNLSADFAFDDGGLVDLLAPGTKMAEWDAFWAALQSSPFVLRGFRDGEPWPLPKSVTKLFTEREEAAVMVSGRSGMAQTLRRVWAAGR